MFRIPTFNAVPQGITAGPDGNVWFTEHNVGKIGRITPAGVITEYPLPNALSGPYDITLGPDGRLWFTEYDAGKLGVLTVRVPGDTNGDGSVNVNDVFLLINFLFAGGAAPQ